MNNFNKLSAEIEARKNELIEACFDEDFKYNLLIFRVLFTNRDFSKVFPIPGNGTCLFSLDILVSNLREGRAEVSVVIFNDKLRLVYSIVNPNTGEPDIDQYDCLADDAEWESDHDIVILGTLDQYDFETVYSQLGE